MTAFERVIGSEKDDNLTGSKHDDVLIGGGGNRQLRRRRGQRRHGRRRRRRHLGRGLQGQRRRQIKGGEGNDTVRYSTRKQAGVGHQRRRWPTTAKPTRRTTSPTSRSPSSRRAGGRDAGRAVHRRFRRVLAGGRRRRDLQLRRRPLLRLGRRHRPQPAGGGHGRHRRPGRATGWWPPTAGSSASATPRSTAPPATSP